MPRSRGFNPRRISAGLPQNPYLSRRIAFLHVASSGDRQTVLIHFRKKRHVEVSLDEMMEPKGESRPTLPEFAATDPNLNGTVDRLSLRWAIRQLPQGSRKLLLLALKGYGPSEIARLVGCSVGNSKSQLHKARRRLGELLSGHCAGRPHRQPGEEVEGRPTDCSSLSASALKETLAT